MNKILNEDFGELKIEELLKEFWIDNSGLALRERINLTAPSFLKEGKIVKLSNFDELITIPEKELYLSIAQIEKILSHLIVKRDSKN